MGCGLDGGESIRDLIGDHDGDVVSPSQAAEKTADLRKLSATFGEHLGALLALVAFVEFGTIVGGDAVDD